MRLFASPRFVLAIAMGVSIASCSGERPPLSTGAAAGPSGAGVSGAAGSTGVAGTVGTAGASGFAGTVGTAGASGFAGTVGTAGASGFAGTVGTAGASGFAGAVGTAGASGFAGASGSAGTTGAGGSGSARACEPMTLPSGLCATGAYKRNGADCQCIQGTTCVCGGACTDPTTDDDNCGACGVKCGPTSTCQGGVCGPPVVNVVSASPGCGAIDLTVSNGTLYWTELNHGIVQQLELASRTRQIIAKGTMPSNVAVFGASVFWLEGRQSIHRLTGGASAAVVKSDPPIGGFVATPDGGTLYFSAETFVYRVDSLAATPVLVAQEQRGGQPKALALSPAGDGIVFPTDFNNDVDYVTFVSGPVATCGDQDANGDFIGFHCTRLARSQGQPFLDAIALTTSGAVWVNLDAVNMEPTQRTPNFFDGVATAEGSISGFAATEKTVAFAADGVDENGKGVIYSAALAPNQTPGRIARGQAGPRALAIDGRRVFWSTSDCTIESATF